jgi:hypothetical protein
MWRAGAHGGFIPLVQDFLQHIHRVQNEALLL